MVNQNKVPAIGASKPHRALVRPFGELRLVMNMVDDMLWTWT